MAEQRVIDYRPPGPVAKAFMESEAFIRGIMGPIGSGKSTACIIEILRRAQMQAKGPDGLRHTRWVVTRNTYPDLKNTTLKSWLDWVPAGFGKLNMSSPISHRIITEDLDIEVLFLALDRDEDVRKLLSFETTGAWINEAKFVPKSILDGMTGRVGRYPAMRDGGPTWAGIVMDTNPPDTESWWYKIAENTDAEMVDQTAALSRELVLQGVLRNGQPMMEFFKQPSGLDPQAENIKNLRPGYYHFASVGKEQDYINVYIHGNYGFVVEGKPVYSMYRDNVHCAPQALDPNPNLPILVGADFGLTPAAVFGQRLPDGRWNVFAEVNTEHCGIKRFGELLAAFVATHYANFQIGVAWGDPAGTAGEEGETAFDILRNTTGWHWRPAPTNDPAIRQEAIIGTLNRMVDGKPGFQLSPACPVLRKGFVSGYHFKFVRSSNGALLHETPAKNGFSHPHDALQYLVLGGGEYEVVHNQAPRKNRNTSRVADGVGENPFGEDGPRQTAGYTNEATMRQLRDGTGVRRSSIAKGTGEGVF